MLFQRNVKKSEKGMGFRENGMGDDGMGTCYKQVSEHWADAQAIGYAFGDIGHGGVLKVENNVELVFSCRSSDLRV